MIQQPGPRSTAWARSIKKFIIQAHIEQSKIVPDRIKRIQFSEVSGQFQYCFPVTFIPSQNSQTLCHPADVDIERNKKSGRGNILPKSKIHLSVRWSDHPAKVHVESLGSRIAGW